MRCCKQASLETLHVLDELDVGDIGNCQSDMSN